MDHQGLCKVVLDNQYKYFFLDGDDEDDLKEKEGEKREEGEEGEEREEGEEGDDVNEGENRTEKQQG